MACWQQFPIYASWNFAINLAAPFFTVHMLKKMDLDILTVMSFAIMSQIAAYVTVAQWGNIADRHVLTIPLLVFIHIATGIASAGVTLASGNLTLKLAPRGKATGYLSASAIVNAASAGSAALIGGFTANFFAAIELGVIVRWADATNTTDLNAMNLTHWDFYFLFATVLGVYALHRLSLVEEHGYIHEAPVLETFAQSAKQGLRNLSTLSGLRAASDFPIDLLRKFLKRKNRLE